LAAAQIGQQAEIEHEQPVELVGERPAGACLPGRQVVVPGLNRTDDEVAERADGGQRGQPAGFHVEHLAFVQFRRSQRSPKPRRQRWRAPQAHRGQLQQALTELAPRGSLLTGIVLGWLASVTPCM